jgi:hypothetical protein
LLTTGVRAAVSRYPLFVRDRCRCGLGLATEPLVVGWAGPPDDTRSVLSPVRLATPRSRIPPVTGVVFKKVHRAKVFVSTVPAVGQSDLI